MDERSTADAIVVGSGFGGAVAAARLAQAGFSVVILERGRRWHAGDLPRRPHLEDGWLWEADRGLYDIRWLDTMGSVQASGWGGGLGQSNPLTPGLHDLISFGRAHLSNPDLVERLRSDLPRVGHDPDTRYQGGDAGYLTYPSYQHCPQQ